MNRISFFAMFAVTVACTNARAAAERPVAPPPREIRPDGTRDPVPQSEPPAPGENPAVTVKRIIENSKDVGDKLAKTDTGTDTRKKQNKILSDIDALINQQENPPPPQPDQNKDKDKNQDKDKSKDKDKSDKKDPMMDPGMAMKNDMPMSGMNMGDPPPMGGMGESQPMGRKPRMGDPMNDTKKEQNSGAKEQNKPESEPKKGGQEPKGTPGKTGGNPMGTMKPGKPSMPFEEDVAKDVWGHLPDKLRQQMSQYYKEDFTPKYAELLRLYYSSLSEKGTKPGEPRK
ncbi:hypothetical protein VT84_20475 [Gemmata sp. SH-PL17]|uniref:hypothetical protein n=1 Tax=Gemmata sp. SH-PL17 TaxID=1630693 RepID=UPI00078ED086|nr:hypothetical protein [Gemmata sp. SH-PL17]AMV26787.1 hypothetical protein VT84_20475 [Gemmata sp. SH-PL17]